MFTMYILLYYFTLFYLIITCILPFNICTLFKRSVSVTTRERLNPILAEGDCPIPLTLNGRLYGEFQPNFQLT